MSDFRWSYSALETFDKCPMQYKFKHIDHLPSDSGPAAARGTKMHDQLEGYLVKNRLLDKIFTKHDGLAKHIANIKAHASTLQCEQRWMIDRDWQPVYNRAQQWAVAKLDYFYFQSTTIGVVGDWKTGKIYPSHESQGKLYAALSFGRAPALKKVRVELVYLDQRQIHDQEYKRSDVKAIQTDFTKRAARVEVASTFPARPSRLCGWCSYSQTKGGPCKAG